MAIGAVSYHDMKMKKIVSCEKDKEVVKRLEKTRREAFPDLEKEKRLRDEQEKKEKKYAIYHFYVTTFIFFLFYLILTKNFILFL